MNKFNSLFFFFLRASFAEREKSFRDSCCKKKHEFISFKLLYLTSKGRILYIGEFSEKIGQDPYLLHNGTTLIITKDKSALIIKA